MMERNGRPGCECKTARIGRRAVLKSGIAFGVGLGIAPNLALSQDDAAGIGPQAGDLLVRERDSSLEPLAPEDIPIGARQVEAWTMDPKTRTVRSGVRKNLLLLLRFDPATLSDTTRSRAADGVVAYSAMCTHGGCEVDDWLGGEQLLHCVCHFGTFDPRDGGRVMDGPPPRPLPGLPLEIVEGKLAVAGSFDPPFLSGRRRPAGAEEHHAGSRPA